MTNLDSTRRRFVIAASTSGAGLMVAAANSSIVRAAEKNSVGDEGKEKEVGAVEDLMREHGIIRRALLVYRECSTKLRAKPGGVDPDALRRTALLFRSFGEDYHEKKLEATYIFPALKKAGGPAADYVLSLKTGAAGKSPITSLRLRAKERLEAATPSRWQMLWTISS
jgi:hypothetical protein